VTFVDHIENGFPETLAYRDTLGRACSASRTAIFFGLAPQCLQCLAEKDSNGLRWSYESRRLLAEIRKVEPLARAKAGLNTGFRDARRLQSGDPQQISALRRLTTVA